MGTSRAGWIAKRRPSEALEKEQRTELERIRVDLKEQGFDENDLLALATVYATRRAGTAVLQKVAEFDATRQRRLIKLLEDADKTHRELHFLLDGRGMNPLDGYRSGGRRRGAGASMVGGGTSCDPSSPCTARGVVRQHAVYRAELRAMVDATGSMREPRFIAARVKRIKETWPHLLRKESILSLLVHDLELKPRQVALLFLSLEEGAAFPIREPRIKKEAHAISVALVPATKERQRRTRRA